MINKGNLWVGAILILLGAIFLFNNLDFMDYPIGWIFRFFWPLLIIIVGLYLIFRSTRKSSQYFPPGSDISGQPGMMFNRASMVFGDLNRDANGIDINGMDYSTTFGDISINLSGGKLTTGDNHVHVSTFFGDVVVIVPKDMEIFAYSSATIGDLHILGKYTSGISSKLTTQTDGFDNASTRVYISIDTTFGDIKVYQA